MLNTSPNWITVGRGIGPNRKEDMIYATSSWSLADVLHNFDPFNYHADFGFIRPNDDRMSAWYCDTSTDYI